ncbi:hypothetical protein PRB81_gp52 [Klebsiella phage VLCpiS13f]|jgi:hypothetical protein|uniref:hypothetical protein n=1 Tax=Klebsiella phage VLCpiS13f TaxID=2874890 RepID=UPI00233ED46F|nr:hypothetical protein PRB81_gp52 [Klebsiella phage VLCpiS13f]UVX29553.1 hypothetical protein S13f_00044 [Klebsiella phage VLCpiS13f]
MSKKVEEFVKRMQSSGVSLTVEGGVVVARNTAGMSGKDIIEMAKLDKNGELAKYLSPR